MNLNNQISITRISNTGKARQRLNVQIFHLTTCDIQQHVNEIYQSQQSTRDLRVIIILPDCYTAPANFSRQF